MGITIRLNVQTRADGKLFGAGVYREEQFSEKAINVFKDYCKAQAALPVENKHIPPYIEIIENSPHRSNGGDNNPVKTEVKDYSKYSLKQLKAECKTMGISFDNTATKSDLINLLVGNDDENVNSDDWDNRFLSPSKFNVFSDELKVEYLDNIFGLPENIDENSEEANKYSEDLIIAVNAYAGLSESNPEVVNKLKEILDYYAE